MCLCKWGILKIAERDLPFQIIILTTVQFQSHKSTFKHNFCFPGCRSVWPAGSRRGGSVWPLPQLVGQRRPVYLQRPGGPAHTDTLEAPVRGQQGHVLHQPLPRVHRRRPGYPGCGDVLQMEEVDGGLRRQHR